MKKLLVILFGLLLIGLAVADPQPLKILGTLFYFGTIGALLFGKKTTGVLGAAGDFGPAELLAIKDFLPAIWDDKTVQKDYIADVQVPLAIRAQQTARLAPLQNPAKDRQLTVVWVKDCVDRLEDCGNECEAGGDELEADSQTYELDLCKSAGFTVKEREFRSLMLDRTEVVAKGFMSSMKQLDNWIAQQTVSHLNTFAGINQYEDGVFQGSEYNEADAAFWNADIFGEFNIIAAINRFSNPFLLSGTNLYKEWWNSMMQAGNADGKGDVMKFGTMPIAFDLHQIVTVNSPDKVTYMLDKGAVALITKAYNPENPLTYSNGANQTLFKVPSMNIPGVEYDVIYKTRCESSEIYHDYSLRVNGLCALNPVGCTETNTGVLKFYCGTASGS